MKKRFKILVVTIILGIIIYLFVQFFIPPTIRSDFQKSWNESELKTQLTSVVSKIKTSSKKYFAQVNENVKVPEFKKNNSEKTQKRVVQKTSKGVTEKTQNETVNKSVDKSSNISTTENSPCGWMEVAAMDKNADKEDNQFITHYVSDYKSTNGAKVRNYSMNYSKKHLVAHWVAYPLCKYYTTKNTERNKKWSNMFDPKVSHSNQQHLSSGYGKTSGFDRGHQLCSADRVGSKEMNMQTFYYTNMTPQVGLRLNRGIWRMLEEKVRTWSNKPGVDTLYVITGCVVDDNCNKYPDNDKKAVSVPYGYYKVLLSYHKNSPKPGYDNGTYKGCAIYYENKEYTRKPQSSDLMSISELEKKIGINFFVNLPKAIGAQKAQSVEDKLEKSFWTF